MKTFKIILATVVATIVLGVAGFVTVAFNSGLVTLESESIEHTKQVVIDGVVQEEETWFDLSQIRFRVNESVATIDM